MKNKVAVTLISLFCLLWQCEAIAGGGKAAYGALKLLGKFALGIVTSIATDKAEAMIDGEDEPPKTNISGYKFNFSWTIYNGTYSGILVMRGMTGSFRVTTPQGDVIDQDMIAQPSNGDVILSGSNPRHAGTSTPISPIYYSPDRFRLANTPQGWTIADTCDYQGICAPVSVTSASTF
jgi:hypothetical protein